MWKNLPPTNEEIFKRAITIYGENMQELVAIEEFAELTKALIKRMRKISPDEYEESVLEELVDCEIMIEQLKIIGKVNKAEFETIKKEKLLRLEKRLDSL